MKAPKCTSCGKRFVDGRDDDDQDGMCGLCSRRGRQPMEASKLEYLDDFEFWLKSINDFDETLFEKGDRLYKDETMNFAYACYRAGRVTGHRLG